MIAYSYYETDHRIINYAESIVDRGFTVDVMGLKKPGELKNHNCLNKINIFYIQQRRSKEKNIVNYFFNIILFFIKGFILLSFRHLKHHYDIIHVHNVPDLLIFMTVLPRLLGAKVILDIHDILPELFCQKLNKDMTSFIAKFLLALENLSVHFADHVIVANEFWKERIQKRTGTEIKKFTAILNYPRQSLFKKVPVASENHYFTIVYPGTISFHHGLDVLIKAMPLVKEKIPNSRLHIYCLSSDEDYLMQLKVLIDKLNLIGFVKFYDKVPHKELIKIYANTNIGVVPKREGIFSSEAFSTKIFDFMATGVPVIASKTRIDEYYFDDSMIMFFEPENHEDLAKCIISLYNDPKKRKCLSDRAAEFVANNYWEIKKNIYLNLLASIQKNV
jgi:glycosyltransferase involved in cell wall biosynthesis